MTGYASRFEVGWYGGVGRSSGSYDGRTRDGGPEYLDRDSGMLAFVFPPVRLMSGHEGSID